MDWMDKVDGIDIHPVHVVHEVCAPGCLNAASSSAWFHLRCFGAQPINPGIQNAEVIL